MSKEELIEAIESLQEEMELQTSELSELTKKNIQLKKKLKANNIADDSDGDDDKESVGMNDALQAAALETENEELREKLSKLQNENTTLKGNNLDLQSQIKVLKSEKSEYDADVRNLRKKIDDLEKTLADNEETMRNSLRKSQDLSKQKKENREQQLQFYDENETLRKEVIFLLDLIFSSQFSFLIFLDVRIKSFKNKTQSGQQLLMNLKN